MKEQNRAVGRFALTHVATAAALTFGLLGSSAYGLGLGRLSVQSALGETLKAEIEVTSLSAEEASTLKVRVAPPDAYRTTGVEYNSILSDAQIQVTQHDGRTVLRLSSDRAVQEPFVDVILELTWASGRLEREYTLLFDPPTTPMAQAAPPTVATAPVITAPPMPAPAVAMAAPAPAPAVSHPMPSASRPKAEAPKPEPKPVQVAQAPKPAPVSPVPAPKPAPAPTAASEVQVKPGDTLSRIAGRVQPEGVSLDQMLVGLYRSNPEAFIDNNMNLLKAGSVLQVPGSDALTSTSDGEAHQVIQAQSADFNAYRQRLAGAAPTLKQDGSDRQAHGKVQAALDEHKSAQAMAPDKLTLSKAASAAAEAKVSKATEKKDAVARVAELTRNVEELKKLSAAAKASTSPPATVATAAQPSLIPSAPAIVAQAAVPVAASAASMARPAMAKHPVPVLPRAEPGLIDNLLGNPTILGLGAVLLIGVGGLGIWRLRGRKQSTKADTGFHESRLQPDSFFGNTGGQRVDTRDASGGASSMSYSLSQLDAIGDVDPVAEADVYLAYGRDLQAEEILKEALRANPSRLAIRLKLLEVYAKRRDTKGFEQLAAQLFAETHGQGDDWVKAQEMGRQIDPENPLYQPGGAPSVSEDGHQIRPEPMDASTLPATVVAPGHMATEAISPSLDAPMSGFDLDLDLDSGPSHTASHAMEATQAMAITVEQSPMGMDFDLSAPPPAAQAEHLPDLHLDLGGSEPAKPVKPAAVKHDESSLDFDLSSIDLDLPTTHAAPAAAHHASEPMPTLEGLESLGGDDGEPLQRQLELADEFRQIGDTEGAREVLHELLEKATGDLRAKAQALLKELN